MKPNDYEELARLYELYGCAEILDAINDIHELIEKPKHADISIDELRGRAEL